MEAEQKRLEEDRTSDMSLWEEENRHTQRVQWYHTVLLMLAIWKAHT